VAETALDDVFADDITFLAPDSAMAVPCNICKGVRQLPLAQADAPVIFLSVGVRGMAEIGRCRRSRIRARHPQRKVEVPQGVT
jgi:hypothetical protein